MTKKYSNALNRTGVCKLLLWLMRCPLTWVGLIGGGRTALLALARGMPRSGGLSGKRESASKQTPRPDPRNLDVGETFIPGPHSNSGPQLNRAEKRVWEFVSRWPLRSLWDLQGVRIRVVAARTWRSMFLDRIFGRAAELGFYFFFALFPTLFSASSILGLAARSAHQFFDRLLDYLALVIPTAANIQRNHRRGQLRQTNVRAHRRHLVRFGRNLRRPGHAQRCV